MIDLYTWTTPNGRKASIMLEECGISYNVIPVNLQKSEQYDARFLGVNPNAKIPVIVDRETGETIAESAAIVYYLAEKCGRFLPAAPRQRWETMKWFLWQTGAVGPSIGVVYFVTRRAPENVSIGERFGKETARTLQLLDDLLASRPYIAGEEYTIADIMGIPWLQAGIGVLEKNWPALVKDWRNLNRWLSEVLQRPAVVRGMACPKV